jgi:tungstate transport system substrate-binding protein
MKRKTFVFSLLVVFCLFISACAPQATAAPAATETTVSAAVVTETVAPLTGPKDIILATTTSTRDSGLLDDLLPRFEAETGYKVKMVAVGSGQALTMGQEGNADVLLVHSPTAELDFMSKGFGKDRFLVMHNDFVIVGPTADPAKIKGTAKAPDAFKKIFDQKAVFVSRADKSGTNSAELAIWKKVGVSPAKTDAWYLQTGQGMGDTLRIASEKGGYTLTDRATYLALKSTLNLDILVEGDISLLNIYHVITVNPDKWPKVNSEGANVFAQWLLKPETQQFIGEFGKEKYGQQLFVPDAGKNEADLGK